MSEDILERAKKALIDDDMTYEDYDECISLLISEVEANQIMLRQFQVHEDQTHAAMEKIVGNSDNFVELTRQMKAEVERLRAVPAWEATDERIAAMKDACNFLVYAEIRNKGVNPGNVNRAKNAGDVLRAMLEEGKRDA